MATKAKAAKAAKADSITRILSASDVQAIANVWAKGDQVLACAGGALALAIAETARERIAESAEPTKADAAAIVECAAKQRGWSEASQRVKMSHCVAFLATRGKLPHAIRRAESEHGACSWNDAYTIAKNLRDGKSEAAALKATSETRKGKGKGKAQPADSAKAKQRAAIYVKEMLSWTHLPATFKRDLRQSCMNAGIKLGKA